MSKRETRIRAKKLGVDVTREFDGEGVRNALLAAVACVYENSPHVTLPQFLVALAVLVADRDGEPHTLATLVKKLHMPYSTASRVVWSLTEAGGDLGLIRYERHPTDRRKKLLIMNPRKQNRAVPREMMRAMVEYYGNSVKNLSRVN
jgi:DNA-binding MarR family transcriptional regulator